VVFFTLLLVGNTVKCRFPNFLFASTIPQAVVHLVMQSQSPFAAGKRKVAVPQSITAPQLLGFAKHS
jgi:hypothetical protein